MTFLNATYAFEHYYDKVLAEGEPLNNTKAIYNVGFYLTYPVEVRIATPWRKWSSAYCEEEWKWYLSGDRNATEIAKRAKIWSGIMDDKNEVNSNYGHWWKRGDQLNHVISLLKKDLTTRRAVIVHYDPEEVATYDKDTPCNLVLNFYHLNGKLNMTVFARSIDLVYGFCNDQFMFSRLLQSVSSQVNTEVGVIFYSITNLHIYEQHFHLKPTNN